MRRAFSSSVFVIHNRKVLLIKHKLLGMWLPVGGELNYSYVADGIKDLTFETPLECAKRELFEETGLVGRFYDRALEGEPVGFLGYEEHLAGPKGYHMNFCFTCFVDTNEVKGDGSFSEHRWFNAAEVVALDDAPMNVKQLVQRLARLADSLHVPEHSS
jgi:8-oxo-dGTP diphosphatase